MKQPPRPILSRRAALKFLSAASITTIGGYALFEYAPWLNYDQQATHIRRPVEQNTILSIHMRELVRYATLAASGHNTQPWMFAITENVIDIHPDTTRRLPAVDPDDRELWISLGCALENLLVAAHAVGYTPTVTYPDLVNSIRVQLTVETPPPSPLFEAIRLRQNTRSAYDGQTVPNVDLSKIESVPLEPGVVLHLITSPTAREILTDYTHQANMFQYADAIFLNELIHWLRFNQKEALAALDGLSTRASGNPEVPRWLGQWVVSNTPPQQQADADTKKLRSSPGAVVITSQGESKSTWVRTGQVYERMALTMTALNIKSAFLNQPIEVATVRGQFQGAMGFGSERPQLLVRFGYAADMPRSLRRPIEQVLV